MFERLTGRAREVVVLAQDEARDLGHDYIGTEHLLLGLLRADGLAARVLEARKIDVETVRSRVVEIVGVTDEVITGQIPFTARTKKVLELSLHETMNLDAKHIDTEHLLLGLVREGQGVGAWILADLGAPPNVLAGEVVAMLQGGETSAGYAQRFAQKVPPLLRSTARRAPLRPGTRLVGSQTPLLLGWALFGVSFALGILAGWLIWA